MTRISSVSLLCFILIFAIQLNARASPQDQELGLVSRWPGDGNANDAVDANHGTLQNGVTFVDATTEGRFDQAFSLDGVDDFVSVPDNPNLDIIDGITIAAWIKPAKGGGTIIDKTQFDDLANYRFFLGLAEEASDGRIGFWNGESYVLSRGSVPFNEYSHVVMALSRGVDADTISMYINGAFDSSNHIELGQINDGQLRIGSDNLGRHFQGQIDDIAIYNRALSQSEIKDIYDRSRTGEIITERHDQLRQVDQFCRFTLTESVESSLSAQQQAGIFISRKYEAFGGVHGILGEARTDVSPGYGGGFYQDFERGTITYSTKTCAHGCLVFLLPHQF